MKNLKYWLPVLLAGCWACSSDNGGGPGDEEEIPVLTASVPADGAREVEAGLTKTVVLTFDRAVTLVQPHGITLNGEAVETASAYLQTVTVAVSLGKGKTYTLHIPAQRIKGPTGELAGEITVAFSTKAPVQQNIRMELVTPAPSAAAEKVYAFLRANYGKNMISGTIANVSWNTNEAEWVFRHTGKYPALNCYDFIHLQASAPGSWIDYSDISVVKDWWNAGGLVACMWHWNVPANNGTDYTCNYGSGAKETSFDIRKINEEGSEEYKRMVADIDKVAGYLKPMQEQGIAVIWRPLHEAAGGWFWWGRDASSFRELWRLMFDRMVNHHGLDNLIWVWTTETEDADWYPGEEYVDIVGRDMYKVKDVTELNAQFESIKALYPDRMVALSECGGVAAMNDQWEAGAAWAWFMPWYDYARTNDTHAAAFGETSHEHADIAWWEKAFGAENVITRDRMPGW